MADYIAQMEMKAARSATTLSLYGFHTQQSNGQRISINLSISEEDALRIENLGQNEIFIGHLPLDAFEDELISALSQAGRIYKIRWMMSFSGSTRGYCFVKYTTREEALMAVRMLNNHRIRPDRGPIGARLSLDNKTLFFGNLSSQVTSQQLVWALERFEVEGIVGAIMIDDSLNDWLQSANCSPSLDLNNNHHHHQFNRNSRKFNCNHNFSKRNQTKRNNHHGHPESEPLGCLILFESHQAATKARRILLPNKISLHNRKLTIDWACKDISKLDLFKMPSFYCNFQIWPNSALPMRRSRATHELLSV